MQHVFWFAANDIGQLEGVFFRISRRQVDLIEHRNNLQFVLHRQVQVRQGLCFDALGGVDKQNSGLTSVQGAGDFIGEVDVARGVVHLQHDLFALVWAGSRHPRQTHGLRLNGDAALALDVHVVEVLITHIALVDNFGQLQDTVRQGGFPVVNMRNDAEVAQALGFGERLRCKIFRHYFLGLPLVVNSHQPTEPRRGVNSQDS